MHDIHGKGIGRDVRALAGFECERELIHGCAHRFVAGYANVALCKALQAARDEPARPSGAGRPASLPPG